MAPPHSRFYISLSSCVILVIWSLPWGKLTHATQSWHRELFVIGDRRCMSFPHFSAQAPGIPQGLALAWSFHQAFNSHFPMMTRRWHLHFILKQWLAILKGSLDWVSTAVAFMWTTVYSRSLHPREDYICSPSFSCHLGSRMWLTTLGKFLTPSPKLHCWWFLLLCQTHV